jgi:hypothetical protein
MPSKNIGLAIISVTVIALYQIKYCPHINSDKYALKPWNMLNGHNAIALNQHIQKM